MMMPLPDSVQRIQQSTFCMDLNQSAWNARAQEKPIWMVV